MTHSSAPPRTLVTACGGLLTICTSAALNAHSEGESRDRQPQWTQDSGQPSDGQPEILSKLEGVWRVEVEVNPSMWGTLHGGRQILEDATPGESGNINRDHSTRDRRDPNRNRFPSGDPPQSADHDDTPIHNGSDYRAIADTKLILDGEILRERMILLDGESAESPDDPAHDLDQKNNDDDDNEDAIENNNIGGQPITEDTARHGIDDATQCLAFISFDEADNSYTMVMMNSKDGEIFHERGQYDATSNRIVFAGGPEGADRQGRQPSMVEPSPDKPDDDAGGRGNQPYRTPSSTDRVREPGRVQPMGGHENVCVVLQLHDNDSYEVTMYAGNTLDRYRADPAANPASDPTSRPGSAPQPESDAFADAMGDIVYRATYTRASASQEALYERLLDTSEEGSTRTSMRNGRP